MKKRRKHFALKSAIAWGWKAKSIRQGSKKEEERKKRA